MSVNVRRKENLGTRSLSSIEDGYVEGVCLFDSRHRPTSKRSVIRVDNEQRERKRKLGWVRTHGSLHLYSQSSYIFSRKNTRLIVILMRKGGNV